MSPHDVMSGANITTHKNAVICLSIFIMSIIFFFTIRCAQPHWSHLRFVSFFLGNIISDQIIGTFIHNDDSTMIIQNLLKNDDTVSKLITFLQSYGMLLIVIFLSVAISCAMILIKKPKKMLFKYFSTIYA